MPRKLLSRQLELGIDAVVVCGTTGESPVLSTEEKQSIFTAAAESLAAKALIISFALGVACIWLLPALERLVEKLQAVNKHSAAITAKRIQNRFFINLPPQCIEVCSHIHRENFH